MNFPLQKATKHIGNLLTPLWIGILTLPLAGLSGAILFAALAAACMILRQLYVTGATTALFRNVLARSSSFFKTTSSILHKHVVTSRGLILLIAALACLPFFLNNYYLDIMTLTGIYIVLALGLNLIAGQAGLLNLGYVAFYAIGAYTYAIFSTLYGMSFWPGLAVGALSSATFAVLLGLPILRLRGDYFAIVTLGLGEITRIVLNNWDAVTGGPNGISQIGRPVFAGYVFQTTVDFYYGALIMVGITVFAMHRLVNSRLGRAWIAIREDEIAAEAMGINTFKLKLLAFVLGSAWAGLAGVFFAAKMAFVSPESFTFIESVMILCMVVLGGMGSIPGVILGAVLLTVIPEIFRDFQDYRMLAFGIALVAMMIFRPQGILGTMKRKA